MNAAARRGIALPESFIRFLRSPELQECFRSGGCWGFMLSHLPVPCPGFDGGYLVAFLCDQQDCVIWCLCLTVEGASCVVAVPSEVLDAMPDIPRDALLGRLLPDEIDGSEEAVSIWSGSDERDASWRRQRPVTGSASAPSLSPRLFTGFGWRTRLAGN